MGISFDLVTVDAVDAAALAAFWSAAAGLVECEREDGGRWIVLASTNIGEPLRRLGIQRIAGLGRADVVWVGAEKPRLHFDLRCEFDEFPAEMDRLLRLGATLVRAERIEPYGCIAAFADPEGNLFDLCAYKLA